MTIRELFLSTLLLAAGIHAAVDDRLYPVEARDTPAQAKRQTPGNNMVNVHVVQVGDMQGSLKFYPDTLRPALGDMIQFQFYPKASIPCSNAMNHSVVQAAFDKPCEPIGRSNPQIAGIKSGFMPIQASANQRPVFTVMVNDTKPMWFYCGQGRHCQNGMVMALNPVAGSNRTVESFRALAAQVGSGNGGSASPSGGLSPSNTIPNNGNPSRTGAAVQTGNSASSLSAHTAGMGGMLLFVAAMVGF
ncbi:hypothetical protein LOZ39_003378 [Ophidiomyces ophidiicola]|nr:hypothetical protein LOZ59_002793 [Ophidiomyces ophidiicola]KAI2010183.1 hypothetical protein LOZ49_003582 [Ophidiomyces ophidiicola]KAI2058105.1 hypothetical protein LOZ43_002756 [Ophidiomyces ophidiicola]KAI2075184.1 hypothetical protein LOZ39_003378 [Ophidiomyces ophidiicola]KAI2086805.1 hypothetical protein LOZ36_003139 [Ophidiomyces ophidiicola]